MRRPEGSARALPSVLFAGPVQNWTKGACDPSLRVETNCARRVTLGLVDANGARALLARIEVNHWCRADAVRDGRQPNCDPDASSLVEVGDGWRLYAGGGEKRLVGDAWAPAALESTDAAA